MTIYQDAMDTFLGQSDPQMDRLAEAIAHCLTSGLVNLRSPIVFRNQMSAGPAMIFLQEGGSPVSIATIMPSNQYSMLGVGVGNEGIVANELVAHPAWSLSGLAAHMGYGNAGTGYPVGYGGGPGGVPIRPANGPFGQQVGGGGGGSGMGPGAGGFAPGQGLVPGLGAFGVPGGLGPNGGRVAGSGGGVGQVESESLGTGYNLPGTQADYPDGGSGNPAHMPAEHVPIGNMGMMLQNVRPTYKVKTTTAHDSGETETVDVYVGEPGSETDSGLELEAYNRFGDVASDEWGFAVWIDNRWELIVPAVNDDPVFLLVKTTTAHDKGESETVAIYSGATKGSESDTSNTETAYNRFADLETDKWAIAAYVDGGYELIAGEC